MMNCAWSLLLQPGAVSLRIFTVWRHDFPFSNEKFISEVLNHDLYRKNFLAACNHKEFDRHYAVAG
jgi:hypothetical protein